MSTIYFKSTFFNFGYSRFKLMFGLSIFFFIFIFLFVGDFTFCPVDTTGGGSERKSPKSEAKPLLDSWYLNKCPHWKISSFSIVQVKTQDKATDIKDTVKDTLYLKNGFPAIALSIYIT